MTDVAHQGRQQAAQAKTDLRAKAREAFDSRGAQIALEEAIVLYALAAGKSPRAINTNDALRLLQKTDFERVGQTVMKELV
jgi:hypothetical protein